MPSIKNRCNWAKELNNYTKPERIKRCINDYQKANTQFLKLLFDNTMHVYQILQSERWKFTDKPNMDFQLEYMIEKENLAEEMKKAEIHVKNVIYEACQQLEQPTSMYAELLVNARLEAVHWIKLINNPHLNRAATFKEFLNAEIGITMEYPKSAIVT